MLFRGVCEHISISNNQVLFLILNMFFMLLSDFHSIYNSKHTQMISYFQTDKWYEMISTAHYQPPKEDIYLCILKMHEQIYLFYHINTKWKSG